MTDKKMPAMTAVERMAVEGVHTHHSLWAVVGAMQPVLPPGLVHGGEVGIVKECHVSQQFTTGSANQADTQVSLLTVSMIQTVYREDHRIIVKPQCSLVSRSQTLTP